MDLNILRIRRFSWLDGSGALVMFSLLIDAILAGAPKQKTYLSPSLGP